MTFVTLLGLSMKTLQFAGNTWQAHRKQIEHNQSKQANSTRLDISCFQTIDKTKTVTSTFQNVALLTAEHRRPHLLRILLLRRPRRLQAANQGSMILEKNFMSTVVSLQLNKVESEAAKILPPPPPPYPPPPPP